jgi:hypothetical protein
MFIFLALISFYNNIISIVSLRYYFPSKYTISTDFQGRCKNNSTLVMLAVLAAVAMLSAALVIVPTTIQQANAQDTIFNQKQSNRCSGPYNP